MDVGNTAWQRSAPGIITFLRRHHPAPQRLVSTTPEPPNWKRLLRYRSAQGRIWWESILWCRAEYWRRCTPASAARNSTLRWYNVNLAGNPPQNPPQQEGGKLVRFAT